MSAPPGPPGDLRAEETLPDGTRVLLRPLMPADRDELAARYLELSESSRRRRFFAAPDELDGPLLDYLTHLDYDHHLALAAFALDEAGGRGIGVARYVREPEHPDRAEVAVTVIDAYQHRGLGTLLLTTLAKAARHRGVATFVSYALWENVGVVDALAEAGGRVEPEEPGVARVELDLPAPGHPPRLWVRAVLGQVARAQRRYLQRPRR